MIATSIEQIPKIVCFDDSPRGRLLLGAAYLFYKQGYDKTTVRQLGEFIGIQSGSLFHHFKSKDDILATVMEQTIIYNLNPAMNEVFATMPGNFNSDKVEIQWGTAWWFLDQKDGMETQIKALSNMGLLSRFIGMLTDSRSFMSFPRHEYFRRLLCNMIANDINQGLLPNDLPFFGKMIQDICYNNLKNFLKLKNQ